jgi:thiamine-phosphate diphosphorylase
LAPDARTVRDELRALEAWLDDAIVAGVDAIQIREPDLESRSLLDLTRRVVSRSGSTRVLVNDRADVALAGGAHGVHLRADSVAAHHVRTLNPEWLIGRSIHLGDDVGAACANTDFLVFGSVFASESKPGRPGVGVEGLQRSAEAALVPVVALGGITPDRVPACIRAGAAGVAGIGIFLPEGRAADAMGVAPAVAALRTALEACRFIAASRGNLLE